MSNVKNIGGWQRRAVIRHSGTPCNLETLPGYWIIPKKFSLNAMQELTSNNVLDVDKAKLEGKTEDEVKVILEKAFTEKKDSEKVDVFNDANFQNMLKVAFLEGVYDHNLDTPVDENGDSVSIEAVVPNHLTLSEKELTKVLEAKNIKFVKVDWNVDLYNAMRKFMDTLFEIYKITMAFNRPLESETSEKSEI